MVATTSTPRNVFRDSTKTLANEPERTADMETQNCESSKLAIGEISALALNHFFAQRAMRAFGAHFDEELRDAGINASQFCMLALLHLREPIVFGSRAGNGPIEPVGQSGTTVPPQAYFNNLPPRRSTETSACHDV